MYKHFLKRMIDLIMSFFGIIVLALPMLVIAIAIKLDSKGPVFFKQKRVGYRKTHFNILKFRTMRTDTPHDAPTHELSDPKKWITKVGGFLRKTSLDELPQLWNVLVGEMSLVGPRPLIPKEAGVHRIRAVLGAASVRPGITGLAQTAGRNERSDLEKAFLDGIYASDVSFGLDLRVLGRTVSTVLGGRGAD